MSTEALAKVEVPNVSEERRRIDFEEEKCYGFINMPVIKTKKFILRPFKKGDEFSLAKNINNKEVHRDTLNIPYPYSLKDARAWLKKCFKEIKNKEKIKFAIDIKGEVIGSVGFTKIEDHKAEIGYWLAKRYWRQGIMSEAVKLTTQYGFEKLKLKRIYAYIFPFNKASIKVLQKAGFKKEGLLKKNVKKNGRFYDDYVFAKIK